MKKLLGILFLFLLWCNVGIAAEREPGTDKKCLYVFERENVFKKKFLPKVNKDKGVFITYIGCNKYYDDWSWDYSLNSDIDLAHEKAYYGCREEIPKYNLTGCHLFSIDDVIVWGKDVAFVAKVEKEIKESSATKVAKNKAEGCIEGDCYNGQGTETFANGYKYVGEFKNGKRHGQGTSTWASGQKHVGEFKDGLPNGQGTETFADGYKYVGEFKDGLRHGQGTSTWIDGATYVGEFKNGLRSGQGTQTFPNGYKYVGEFKNDKRHGQGTATWANGDKHVGEFKNDLPNGQGIFTYADGKKIVGEWKDGLTDQDTKVAKIKAEGCIEGDCNNGQGTQTFANGYKYVGEFKNGLRSGQGTSTWASGDKYVGEFKNNLPNGQGTFTWGGENPTWPEKYVGEFKDGLRHGQGIQTWVNGKKYVGGYKNDFRHGQGTYTHPDGYKYVGEWYMGQPFEEDVNYVFNYALSYGNIFTKQSPTTFKKLTFNKERNLETLKGDRLSDLRRNKKKRFKSFQFTAEYEENITVEIFVEHQDDAKNLKRAEYQAFKYANMFGQMPHFLKIYTDKIYIHKNEGKDTGMWWAQPRKKEFHIKRSRCSAQRHYSECAVVMLHELAHILQGLTGVISPSKWGEAKKLDNKKYCSKYAKKDDWEDFAESIMCWVGVRYKSDQLTKSHVEKIKEYIPNRLKFFDELNFNMYPIN